MNWNNPEDELIDIKITLNKKYIVHHASTDFVLILRWVHINLAHFPPRKKGGHFPAYLRAA